MDSETIGCGCDSLESQCVFKSKQPKCKDKQARRNGWRAKALAVRWGCLWQQVVSASGSHLACEHDWSSLIPSVVRDSQGFQSCLKQGAPNKVAAKGIFHTLLSKWHLVFHPLGYVCKLIYTFWPFDIKYCVIKHIFSYWSWPHLRAGVRTGWKLVAADDGRISLDLITPPHFSSRERNQSMVFVVCLFFGTTTCQVSFCQDFDSQPCESKAVQ